MSGWLRALRAASPPSPHFEEKGREGTGAPRPARAVTTWRAVRRTALATALLLFAGVAALAVVWQRTGPVSLARAEALSVTVLDRNDRLLRAYTAVDGHWRLPVEVKDVDPRYLAMLLAFEDRRFRSHRGVDPYAIGRAAWLLIRHMRVVSGGSTLTMQVARLLQGEHERTGAGKVRQALRALALERKFSKDAILRLYLRLAPLEATSRVCGRPRSPILARSRAVSRSRRPPCSWRCRNHLRYGGRIAFRKPRAARAIACWLSLPHRASSPARKRPVRWRSAYRRCGANFLCWLPTWLTRRWRPTKPGSSTVSRSMHPPRPASNG